MLTFIAGTLSTLSDTPPIITVTVTIPSNAGLANDADEGRYLFRSMTVSIFDDAPAMEMTSSGISTDSIASKSFPLPAISTVSGLRITFPVIW